MFSIAQPCPHCGGRGQVQSLNAADFIQSEICIECNGVGYTTPRNTGMRTIVITGSGDIELGAKLCEAYGCAGLIAPFVNGQYAYGYLHMTTTDPKQLLLVRGVEFISVDEAIKVLL